MKVVEFWNNGRLRPGIYLADGKLLAEPGDQNSASSLTTASLLEFLTEHPGSVPKTFAELTVENLRLGPPISNPQKLICIGKNYADHAAEMGGTAPEIPVVFNKFSSSIVGSGSDIVLPSISQQVDFEAELVVVIGRTGKAIPRSKAFEYIAGCCCGNDISARDWQKGRPGGQWLVGKTFDTFAPIGPWIATMDEVGDLTGLDIELRLNGEVMQSSNTRHLIFGIDVLIEHISKFVTLVPGDLIFTGTPAGVGAGRDPQVFLKDGDELEVEIEGLGILRNPVRSDKPNSKS